ncbi:MAG: alpha-amylase family glycosyl hydrolase [Acidobacteriota bacterium]
MDEGAGRPQYRLEPDYTRPLLEIPEAIEQRIRKRIRFLYGDAREDAVYREVERTILVHCAHATPEVIAFERRFDPTQRFTERDVVLITYGDLIVSGDRPPLKTLADFATVFFRGIITTLHVLPFYPYSSDRGFAVTSYKEVDPSLGTWEEIRDIASSFKLMFDGVLNHMSSKSETFQRFLDGDPDVRDYFIAFSTKKAIDDDHLKLILRPRTSPLLTEFPTIKGQRFVWTTFSADQIDLNYKNPKVLIDVLEVLLGYCRRGADLIRLDAVTYLWHELGTSCAHLEQTHEIVKLIRDVLDAAAPHVGIITETNVPHRDNITYFGDGSDEAQMVYNFALPPILLHTFLKGDAGALSRWAGTLAPPSSTTAFFNFLDSHDGIGLLGARDILTPLEIAALCDWVREEGGFVSVRTDGDGKESPYELNITWFSALNGGSQLDPVEIQVARFMASRAVALSLRGVPGIYLPSMFGSANDVDAVYRDGTYRSINRAAIDEEQLLQAFADPGSVPARIARSYIRLLDVRVHEPAFHPNGDQKVLDLSPAVFATVRTSPDLASRVVCLINVTREAVPLDVPLGATCVCGSALHDLITGRSISPDSDPWHLVMEPYQIMWLKE